MVNNRKTGSVMIVGGGIAGIQASLDLADSGYKVYLVESSTAIGGRMAQLDKTFPTNDCSMCTISPRLVAAGTHRNIEILTNAELTSLQGQAGNFNAKVLLKPNYIDLEKCTGCGECAQSCPVGLKDSYNQSLCDRKAIFKLYPQAVPDKFSITREGVAPCYDACPIHGNPSGYVALAAQGMFAEAFESANAKNPFPSICGRICEHPCELSCNRADYDSPVSIAYIKRFLADWYDANGEKLTPEQKQKDIVENGKKVAVIGGGPAGLTCALELRKMGYDVTVFEKHKMLGGMMILGVPSYRLPSDVIERDIKENILDYGVKVQLGTEIAKSDLEKFLQGSFEAVYLAVGSHKSAKLGIEGEDLDGVSYGIEFLRDVRLGQKNQVKEKVTVIGGGNVAMDCARTAVRLGAKQVSVVCLESEDKMPANDWEIEWAKEEGIAIYDGKATRQILSEDSSFAGLEMLDVKRMEFVDGKLELETIPGTERKLESQELIIAIGQKPAMEGLDDTFKLNGRGVIETDQKNWSTSVKGVFSGGDAVRGAASVVQAIADGTEAAKSIDAYIRGQKYEPEEQKEAVVEIDADELRKRKEPVTTRAKMPTIPLEQRRNSFDEVDLGFTEEMAVAEASRCLYCAICSACGLCEKVCEAGAILYDDVAKERQIAVGSVILAPGFDTYDATGKGEYGYGRFPNVVTGLDYERIMCASGPFEGHIQRPSDGVKPKKFAFIQCVGSRDEQNSYCSSVCCMYAIKQAILTKEHIPDAECKVFVMDVRAFGKGFDEYYERAKKKYGVEFVYTRPSCVRQDFQTNNLFLEYTEDGKNWVEGEFDMVILGGGLCPSETTRKLSQVCGINLNEFGFGKSDSYYRTNSVRNGIFLAGAFEEPKDIPESVTQATAAAAQAMEILADVRGTEVVAKEYPPEKDVEGLEPRIGVFVCHCGSNIGGVIDCEKIAKAVSDLKNVEFTTDLMYSCSPDGLKSIRESIEKYELNRVVVASCTPRTHEPLFQEATREAGLNAYLFEMANIRDQCTWVHSHFGQATEGKAIDLIKMAVGRARMIEPLKTQSYEPLRSVLIVGGGAAGLTAAISIAKQGYKVDLVEQSDRLGGNLLKVKRTADGHKPAELARQLVEFVSSNEMITVHLNTEILASKGFVGNFKSTAVVRDSDDDPERGFEIEHGATIIATGAVESRPTEYLYGENDNVMTQLEFENRLEDDPGFARNINELVMIQCVGSREQGNMVCSRVCCTEAIKNAIALKRTNPDAKIAILYRDVRTYGFREQYYNQARELGILFFRYDVDDKPVVRDGGSGKLQVSVRDQNSGLVIGFDPDALVLSAAMKTSADTEKVGTAFKVPVALDGFFLEAHMKLRPIDFASDGMFLCGTCHSPRFIDEAIAQGQATAAKAVSIVSSDMMEISGIVSVVNPDLCAACLTCVRTCPYDVPVINDDGVAEIEAAMCHGCGICAAECPAKAIEVMHYKDSQVIAKVDALFKEKCSCEMAERD